MKAVYKTFLTLSTLVLAPAAFTNRTDDLAGLLVASEVAPRSTLAAGDTLLRVGATGFAAGALPYGPDRTGFVEFGQYLAELTLLPDGRMLAISTEDDSSLGRQRIFLSRIGSDGVPQRLGEVDLVPDVLGETPLDLKADAAGRLFLLTSVYVYWNPPEFYSRLVEIDPNDATTLSSIRLPRDVSAVAVGPELLWAVSEGGLRTLDPATGRIGGPSLSLAPYGPSDIDVDSSGAIWFWQEGVCSPPCAFFYRLDPATGAITEGIGPTNNYVVMQDIAIERRCQESLTARCLQGGRFRAELTWKDFAGQSGAGQVATGRSADTALFYFFEKKNWELMVKVLNGCEQNGHFWVYGSASTTVEYSLRVTDLETGAVRTYTNMANELAKTITDNTAFACE